MYKIKRLQDIQISDMTLKSQYYNDMFSGNFTNAYNIIENNPQLSSKVLNAQNLNNLINGILYLENLYKQNVTDVFYNYIISIDELIFLNEWNPELKYVINNFVYYNNELYYCIKNTELGIEPTNEEYWLYLGLRGEEGYPSLGIKYIGNWNNNFSYNEYNAVSYNDKIYVSNVDNNINNNPEISENWTLCVDKELQKFYISKEPPIEITTGGIWLEII